MHFNSRQSYYFLASPYSENDKEEAYQYHTSQEVAAHFLDEGISIFSPILYNKAILKAFVNLSLDQKRKLLMPLNLDFLYRSKGMLLLKIDGWDSSWSVLQYIEICEKENIPIFDLNPNSVEETLDLIEQTIPISLKEKYAIFQSLPEFQDQSLPSRTRDPFVIASFLSEKPAKVSYGFCGMCDSTLSNEWVFSTNRQYELRHLVDRKILRTSELDLLINALETKKLDNFWDNDSQESTNFNDISENYVNKFKELHKWKILSTQILDGIKITATIVYHFWIKSQWHPTRNGNIYNPALDVTVYKWFDDWVFAKDNIHYKGHLSKKHAKLAAFKYCIYGDTKE